jgi:hypothetical protein
VEEASFLTSSVYHFLRSWYHLPDLPIWDSGEDPELQHV